MDFSEVPAKELAVARASEFRQLARDRQKEVKRNRRRSMVKPSSPSMGELLGLKCVFSDEEALRAMLP
eukprot:278327-Lingulodinium_polyedra.AAC.1